jgi:hypothetical protein
VAVGLEVVVARVDRAALLARDVAFRHQVAGAGVRLRHQEVDPIDERRGVEGGRVDGHLLADRAREPGVERQQELLELPFLGGVQIQEDRR